METPADLATYSGEQKEKKRFFGEYKPPRLACPKSRKGVVAPFPYRSLVTILVTL
jgi:hypothetical protein